MSAATAPLRSTSRIAILGDSLAVLDVFTPIYTIARAYYKGGSAVRNANLSVGTPANPLTPTWLNAGHSGERADQMDARVVADIVNVTPQPNFVLVEAGTNDVLQGTANGPFTTSYRSILTKMINGGIAPGNIICVSIICVASEKVGAGDANAADIVAKNAIIATAATDFGCVYADLRTPQQAWEVINNPTNDNSGHMTTDGTHPNATGITLISGWGGWMWTSITLVPL